MTMKPITPTILAGPFGFYGTVDRIVIGRRRDTKPEAAEDAGKIAEWLKCSPFAAPHAWREIS